ncbi:NAD(P)/FAD-dependent oxidoreductase [Candidatus Omnitrophota bacterium]
MYEVAIVGGGIAGCTAAIYASRKRMNFLLITKKLGGQMLESGEILNYPGVVETDGAEFSAVFEKQLAFNNVKPNTGEVVESIEKTESGFRVKSDKNSYETKTVIIATGSIPRKLGVPGEDKYANKGVTYCSICDGPLFSGKDIAIVGAGNSALEGVDFTKDIARKIYLVNIAKDFNAHEYLIEKVSSYKNVEVINEAKTVEVAGEKFVNGLIYEKGGKKQRLDVAGIIVEVGRIPTTEFVEGFLKLDEHKHIVIDCQGRTSVEGVFAAGDCSSVHEYQYTIAAGQGCIALLKAARYLANKEWQA